MSMYYTATYSPDDNKLRLYASQRLDALTYQRVKAAGFKWAPAQELFVAPMWTPEREDLCIELAGELDDEDRTLVERADARADRFEGYSESRTEDAETARRKVQVLTDAMNGQPVLVGHHSEKRHRKDLQRVQDGIHKAVTCWKQAEYWTQRAAGARQHAKYLQRPDVRARRIKGLEAEQRKMQRRVTEAAGWIKLWRADGLTLERARVLANHGHGYVEREYTHPSGYVGPLSAWDALKGDPPLRPLEEVRDKVTAQMELQLQADQRWATHYHDRLQYERAMLADQGGTVADRTGPEVGGGCRCWASPRGGWSFIRKVNKVSVTVEDNWGNGGANFTRTIPFDKLAGVMTLAEVEQARTAGRLKATEDGIGFYYIPAEAPEEVQS